MEKLVTGKPLRKLVKVKHFLPQPRNAENLVKATNMAIEYLEKQMALGQDVELSESKQTNSAFFGYQVHHYITDEGALMWREDYGENQQ